MAFSLLVSTIPVNLVQAKTWGNKLKSKNALFGLVASFLIWGNDISSNKYFCYFLNDIKGIFLGFLAGGLPGACFIIWPVC